MERVHNFNPGPAALPLEVLKQAQEEFLDFKGEGMSILESSHRAKSFDALIIDAKKDLKSIMGLSDEYDVLFLGGGASTQFAMIPYNFLKEGTTADYINTGTWATAAIKESKKLGKTNVIASSEDREFRYIPKDFKIDPDACYLHITSNNTIRGTQWQSFPDTGNVPLICDMSSDFLSKKLDFSKFSLIYAGAQKNIGPAGVTVIVIKKSMLEKQRSGDLLTMLNYKTHIEKESLHNTPPVFPIYIVALVLKWVIKQGGLPAIEKLNDKKAGLLYSCLDNSNGFYRPTADKDSRSKMNITFRLPSEELEEKIAGEAKKAKLIGLKGHRSVGGLRASFYNAVSLESAEKLVEFLENFRKANS